MSDRALVVAANNYDRNRYKRILQELDVEAIDRFKTTPEAHQLFRLLKPELVILDFLIPTISGLDMIRAMKNDYDGATIIFLTPVDTRSLIERAFRLRAEDILVK